LQKSGHKPLVLMGGGTTKVGDPSGKDESRKLMTYDMIQENIDSISQVFRRFLSFGEGPTDAKLVNNDEWLSPIRYLDFLRDYGQHFTINRMLNFESVKVRLERESPLSFLEFNYMILQAYDFLELSRRHKAVLQLGGSDQWGNIINGVELSRKVDGKHLFGLTAPLMTTSDGKKMGKTASGAVWLKRELLSEYDYWQFWRNTNDADVLRFLKLFTEVPLEKIEELSNLEGAQINQAKVLLADEATKLLHGEECLAEIHATVANLFSENSSGGNTAALPRVVVGKAEFGEGGLQVAELFVRLELAKSKAEARRLIKGGGARLDGEAIKDETFVVTVDSFAKPEIMLSAGKKKHGIVELAA
jgi:tyrosyl-tRNA synthetase